MYIKLRSEELHRDEMEDIRKMNMILICIKNASIMQTRSFEAKKKNEMDTQIIKRNKNVYTMHLIQWK